MHIQPATDPVLWDAFLSHQPWTPFLQSWTMGEVYSDIGQQPVRLQAMRDGKFLAICFGHIVPARRGKHIAIPYGPLFDTQLKPADVDVLIPELFGKLTDVARSNGCSFIRMSPFLETKDGDGLMGGLRKAGMKPVSSPLHLLAEHVWYLPLRGMENGKWKMENTRSEEEILACMRKTTRNLIRRAERDGVTIEASDDPVRDLPLFLALHDETRKRHGFTPYTNAFFRSQVEKFSKKNECTLYLARYQGDVISASIHMHVGGETSYHHGASASAYSKIPASYLLQWTAIKDAMKRGDKIYNFWGIAPSEDGSSKFQVPSSKKHPFAGVTLFKTGFGGQVLNLMHATDIPVTSSYWITYGFEMVRKWRRGF